MKCLGINEGWRFKRTDQEQWFEAKVPGSVYCDLLNNNLIEDPFYRDNEDAAFKLADFDFEYKTSFVVNSDVLDDDLVILHFEGLDTLAEIWLNSKHIASTDNMHREYKFDVKSDLIEGENQLHIIFRSPMEYIKRKQKELEVWGVTPQAEGYPHLRKAHYMFGWDWGPSLPDAGIWRPVSLKSWPVVKLNDIYISQKHIDGRVLLSSRVRFKPLNLEAKKLYLKQIIEDPKGGVSEKQVSLDKAHVLLGMDADGESLECLFDTEIENPQLWWPNGLGEQALYNLKYELLDETGSVLDRDEKTIGLRTITICTDKYEWGEKFEFVVNGKGIFAMGANYIPEDNLLSRVTRERTEHLIQQCVKANYNCIRVWGGGIYPDNSFFELCDKYGLIVWQDFMFACSLYNVNDKFLENIRLEAADNLKRFRHHASLGLLCGNNEIESAVADWNIQPLTPQLKTGYIKLFEVLLPEVCKEHAPDIFYWPSSPSSGGSFDSPGDENRGDVHYWSVWHGRAPFTEVRNYHFRFASEFGMQSFPSMKTIESFTLPEERNIFSYVMEKHQKSPSGNEKILFYISDYLKYPKNLDSISYCSQVLQGEAIRYGVEHWRRNRGRCMGSIYWQVNDCYPVASWSSLDSYYRWKALHYFAKGFYSPILASVHDEGTKLSFHITNDTLNDYHGEFKWRLRTNTGAIVKELGYAVSVPELSAIKLDELDFEPELSSRKHLTTMFVEYCLDGVSCGTVLFVRPKQFELIKPQIKVDVKDCGEYFEITLNSDVYARFVELDIDGADGVFSDNFFDLVGGGEEKTIILEKKDIRNGRVDELKSALKIRSLFDTYD